jgi:hypothetical protein
MEFIPDDMITMGKSHLYFAWFVGLILLVIVSSLSHAGFSLGLTLDRLSASSWVMDDIKVDLDLNSAQQLILNLTAASFRHHALSGAFDEIRLECPVQLIQQRFRCSNGRLRVSDSPYGPQDLKVSGEFVDSEQIKLSTEGFKLAGGRIDVNLETNDGRWTIALNGNALSLDPLRRQFATNLLPDGTALTGNATLVARITGQRDIPSGVDLNLKVDNFAYADTEGLDVAEDGQFTLRLDANRKGSSEWRGDLQLSMGHGQFYVDPYFIEVVNEPLSAQLKGRWSPSTAWLRIDQGEVVIPQVLESRGKLQVNLSTSEVVEADVALSSENVDALYRLFLQPMLIGSMLDELAAHGALQTHLVVKNSEMLSLQVILDEVDLDDRRGLFALYGLNGRLVWRGDDHPDRSSLSAQGGQLYRIDFGPLRIHAHAQQGEVILEEPVELPVMQGSLLIDRFHAHGVFAETPSWTTKAQLKDISLTALAEAFGWPPMEGNLNGLIPNLHYQQKRLEMEGQLVVDVFGGRIRVDELLIEEPFGRVPELFADLQLEALDLGQITQTFSFGHIQGGLEGEISDLHLASWEPIAFDAHFKTPNRDKASHRISQRAVDNLTALGNGVGSGLSNTFLGIFKEFRYDRIELRANLKGSVAHLDGMSHPDGGYYIVKGSGLPRIDVIARNRQVAWKTLLERLKQIRVEGMEVR